MTTPLKTRILVADDHPIVLRGLKTVLNAQPDCEVVAEATDGEEAVNLALTEDVHLAILDISMPRKTGLQAAREITHRKPEVRVLMLSMHDNEQYLFEAIKVGGISATAATEKILMMLFCSMVTTPSMASSRN